MDTVLLIIRVLVALAFIMAGGMKAAMPKGKLAENMAWVEDFSDSQVKIIGVLELLGGLGLLIPFIIPSLDILSLLAAIGLVLTMIGAVYTHIKRGEMPMIVPPAVLGVLAAIVAITQ